MTNGESKSPKSPELADRIREGDVSALDAFVAGQRPPLVRFAVSVRGNVWSARRRHLGRWTMVARHIRLDRVPRCKATNQMPRAAGWCPHRQADVADKLGLTLAIGPRIVRLLSLKV